MRNNPRHLVVTGAHGLIGQEVVRQLLARGDSVTALIHKASDEARFDAPRLKTIAVDLAQDAKAALESLGSFDGLIHLAQASGWHNFPKRAGAVAALSVGASALLAEVAIAAGARHFVMASSGGVYGPSAHPLTEHAPIKPAQELGFYLAAKAASEQLLAYFKPYITIHVLRPFFVYGPGQASSFLIPRLIQSIKTGSPVRLDGGRGPLLNPIYVTDAAAAFIAALDVPESLTANIAGPDVVTLRDIVDILAAQMGASAVFDEQEKAPDDYVANIAVMRRTLLTPKFSLQEGLHNMLRHLNQANPAEQADLR